MKVWVVRKSTGDEAQDVAFKVFATKAKATKWATEEIMEHLEIMERGTEKKMVELLQRRNFRELGKKTGLWICVSSMEIK